MAFKRSGLLKNGAGLAVTESRVGSTLEQGMSWGVCCIAQSHSRMSDLKNFKPPPPQSFCFLGYPATRGEALGHTVPSSAGSRGRKQEWGSGQTLNTESRGRTGFGRAGSHGIFLVSQLSLASRRIPVEDASRTPFPRPGHNTTPPPPPPGLTSEGLQVGAPPGAGSPTAAAGSWSSCAGQFCRGWCVVGSSGGVPHCLRPEAGRPCSPAGSGNCTASRWAGQARSPDPRQATGSEPVSRGPAIRGQVFFRPRGF